MTTKTFWLAALALVTVLPSAAVADEGGASVIADPALAYGEWNERVVLDLPPAANGSAPEVALVASHRAADGVVGAGWRLAAGSSIRRRSATGGVPGFDAALADSMFLLDGVELVPVSDPGVDHFQPETYDGSRLDYNATTDTWTRKNNGWTWTYGDVAAGATRRIVTTVPFPGCQAPCNTETWFVRKAVDPFGNTINFTYTVAPIPSSLASTYSPITTSADHLIDTITYAASKAVVTFTYATRPDISVDMSGVVPVFSHRRLTQVRATADGQLYSRYTMQYEDQGGPTGLLGQLTDCSGEAVAPAAVAPRQSLLRKVHRTGDTSTDPKRVIRCNTYNHSPIQWYASGQGIDGVPDTFASSPKGASVDPLTDTWAPMPSDLDGDGIMDLIVLADRADGNNNYDRVYIATPDRPTPFTTADGGGDAGVLAGSWQAHVNEVFDDIHDAGGRALVDLDGDRVPELVYQSSGGTVVIESPERIIASNGSLTGLAWNPWTHALEPCDVKYGQFGDVDGDRTVDLIIRAHGGDDACARDDRTRWIKNLGESPWFESRAAVELLVPLEGSALPAEWEDAVDACGALGVNPPTDYQPGWNAAAYVADQARFDDFNDDGVLDVAYALYACWDDASGAWAANTDSAYSRIFYGNGRWFIDSGLSAGPPTLLDAANWGTPIYRRLTTGTLATMDLDNDGNGELLQSTYDALGRGFGIGARSLTSIDPAIGYGVAVDALLAPSWDGTPPAEGADIPIVPFRGQAWDCIADASVAPTWGDFDGDGFVDLITVENDGSALFAVLRRSNRVVAEGRMIATDNEHGGRTHLTWGFSARSPNANPELPANLEVIEEVSGPGGSRAMTYSGATVAGDDVTPFATVTATNDRGGVEVYSFVLAPYARGKQHLGVRFRENATIEHVTVTHHGERFDGGFYVGLARPYFNPLVRRCEYDIGFKAVDVDILVSQCFDVTWLAPAVAQSAPPIDVDHVELDGQNHRMLLGHDRSGGELFQRIWTGGGGRRRIAPRIDITPAASIAGGIATALEGVSPVGSPDYYRWPTPGELSGVLPNIEAQEAAYAYPPLAFIAPPDAYVWDFAYDHPVRKLSARYEHRDLATVLDDRSIATTWKQPLATGYWYELAAEETLDHAGARLSWLERSNFFKFDTAQTVLRCGRTSPDDCVTDQYQWFANGTLKTHTFPDQKTESWTQLAWCGEPTTHTDVLGRVTTYSRTIGRCLVGAFKRDGATSTFTYDALLRPTKQVLAPGSGIGTSATIIRTFYYDDALAYREDSSYVEPRRAIRRGDGQLELIHADGLGRTTRRTECMDAGASSSGGDIGAVACQSGTARHVEWNLYAASGPLLVAVGSFEPGETPSSIAYGYDGQHRPIVVMTPVHEHGNVGWHASTIRYGDGYEERTEQTASGPLTTRHDHSTIAESVTVGGVGRGSLRKDALGLVTRVTEPDGTGTALTYDGMHRLASELRVDAAGKALQEDCVMPDGSTQRRPSEHAITARDALGRVLEEVLPDDTVVSYGYDLAGRITSREIDGIRVQSTVYTAPTVSAKGTIAVTDELGGSTTIELVDGLGRTWSRSGPRLSEQWTYNYTGRLIRTRRDGLATDFFYDIHDDVTSIVHPATGTTTLDHDGAGRVVSRTDADGAVDRYRYTFSGALYRHELGDTVVAERTYDPRGQVVAAIDRGVATASEYDDLGRLTKHREGVDGAGELRGTSYFYDAGDRITEVRRTPAGGLQTAATQHFYDNWGRMRERVDPSGKSIQYLFDAADRVRRTIDQEGAALDTLYDRLGRITDRQVPGGEWQHIRYAGRETYAGESNLDLVVTFDDEDAARDVDTRRYVDGTGHVVAEIGPDGSSKTWQWANGRVTRTALVGADGAEYRATDYAYHPVTGQLASTTEGPYTVHYDYTTAGRIERVTTPDDVLERTYDDDGLLASVTEAGVQHRYGRNSVGWIVTEASQVGSGPIRNLEIGRDDLGRVGLMEYSVDDNSRPTVRRQFAAFDYFDNAWLETSTIGTYNVVEVGTFDSQGRRLTRTTSGTGLPARTTTWDWLDNGALGKLTPPSGQTIKYDYGPAFDHQIDRVMVGTTEVARIDGRDARGRVTAMTLPTIGQTRTIGYDDAGRIRSRVTSAAATPSFEWQSTYNPDGTLASETIDDYAGADGWVNHYGYDDAGRLILEVAGKTDSSHLYELDAAGNRLTTTTTTGLNGTPSTSVTMTATYDGPRLATVNGTTVAYDSWNAVSIDHHGNQYTRTADGELAVLGGGGSGAIIGRNARGEPIAALEAGPVMRRTTWDLSSAALPLEVDEGDGDVLTYLTVEGIHLGTMVGGALTPVIADSRATALKHGSDVLGDATAFGFGLVPPPSSGDRFTFAMLERVPSANEVMLARHRTYDPITGRFLEPDPIGAAGGLELYHYGHGDPINNVDPSGFSPIGDSCPSPFPSMGFNKLEPRTYDFEVRAIGDAALAPLDAPWTPQFFDLIIKWAQQGGGHPMTPPGMPGGPLCVMNCAEGDEPFIAEDGLLEIVVNGKRPDDTTAPGGSGSSDGVNDGEDEFLAEGPITRSSFWDPLAYTVGETVLSLGISEGIGRGQDFLEDQWWSPGHRVFPTWWLDSTAYYSLGVIGVGVALWNGWTNDDAVDWLSNPVNQGEMSVAAGLVSAGSAAKTLPRLRATRGAVPKPPSPSVNRVASRMRPPNTHLLQSPSYTGATAKYLEGIDGLWKDPARVAGLLEDFDLALGNEVRRGMTVADAAEAILTADESLASLGKAIDLPPVMLDEEVFAEIIAKGALFRDPAFASGAHGAQTHRIQAWIIRRAASQTPDQFGSGSFRSMLMEIGDKKGGHGDGSWGWQQHFDCCYEGRPISINTRIDSPATPEFFGRVASAGDHFPYVSQLW